MHALSLAVVSRDYSLEVEHGLLLAVVSPVEEHGLSGMQASAVAAHGLSSCGSQVLEFRLSSCDVWV